MTRSPQDPAADPAYEPGAEWMRRVHRRNRSWFVLLLITPVVIGIVAVLAITTKGPPEPSVAPASVPVGYRAISDAYFGYAIPQSWRAGPSFSDSNGDFFYGGAGGWVGENLGIEKTAPSPGRDVPVQLATFGQSRPVPYTLGPARPVTVPGATAAWEYDFVRNDGSRAIALEAWEKSSQTQLWLLVDADPAVTASILASVEGFTASATPAHALSGVHPTRAFTA